MKNLDYKELENILTLIQKNPSTTLGLFTNKDKEFISFLNSFSKRNQIEFIINITDKDFFEEIKNSFNNAKFFNLNRPKYMLNGKFYDYLFVNLDLDENFIAQFLKRVHNIIKNAGLILIVIKNRDYENIDKYSQLLEENYYVATSTIEIDKNYSLLISRKMHGWGG